MKNKMNDNTYEGLKQAVNLPVATENMDWAIPFKIYKMAKYSIPSFLNAIKI